jgi:GNAT superfamily N-acetyltransferase
MIFREALVSDIPQMQLVRNSVHENRLSDPSIIKDEDYIPYLTQTGKGWVCIVNNTVVGFAIVDVKTCNVWALFVSPEDEGAGIGKNLHRRMLDWYFEHHSYLLWLGTAPGTRAEKFYRKNGWVQIGTTNNEELKFEMSKEDWLKV